MASASLPRQARSDIGKILAIVVRRRMAEIGMPNDCTWYMYCDTMSKKCWLLPAVDEQS